MQYYPNLMWKKKKSKSRLQTINMKLIVKNKYPDILKYKMMAEEGCSSQGSEPFLVFAIIQLLTTALNTFITSLTGYVKLIPSSWICFVALDAPLRVCCCFICCCFEGFPPNSKILLPRLAAVRCLSQLWLFWWFIIWSNREWTHSSLSPGFASSWGAIAKHLWVTLTVMVDSLQVHSFSAKQIWRAI